MFCVSCGVNLPDQAKFCSSCGTQALPPQTSEVLTLNPSTEQRRTPLEDSLKPFINREFREKLLECYLGWSTSKELTDWLRNMGKAQVVPLKKRRRDYGNIPNIYL